MMRFGSLFAGIGGFDLGLERAGMTCAWQVEIDPFCQRILAKHWPNVNRYEDVRNVGRNNLEPVDLVCGGFPCQPHSLAGKRAGAADDRDLWPEMRRIVGELRPRWVCSENVVGIRTTILDQVLFDLEGLGYTARAIDVPAAGVGAPHIRYRIWIVAHADSGICEDVPDRESARLSGREFGPDKGKNARGETEGQRSPRGPDGFRGSGIERGWWEAEPDVGRVVYGISGRVDRLRALGNAVVPQVVELIGRAIVKADSHCAES